MRYLMFFVILTLGYGALPVHGQDGAQSPAEPSPRALEGIDARRAMALANEWGPLVQSGVTTEGVTFTFPDGFRRLVPTPPDEVVIAVAPYVSQTHDCETHAMSSCQGQLTGIPIQVTARREDGTVLIDETMTTLANGFLELWLPRDLDVHLTVEAIGYTAEAIVSTRSGSYTCITTMQFGGDGEG